MLFVPFGSVRRDRVSGKFACHILDCTLVVGEVELGGHPAALVRPPEKSVSILIGFVMPVMRFALSALKMCWLFGRGSTRRRFWAFQPSFNAAPRKDLCCHNYLTLVLH